MSKSLRLQFLDGTQIKILLPRNASLQNFVSIYRKICAPELSIKLAAFECLPLKDAIKIAFSGKEVCGKHIDHLRRTPKKSIKQASHKLAKRVEDLQNCSSFEMLYEKIHQSIKEIPKLKEMYCYDTALRIGASKRVWPDKIYLQRGAFEGAKRLLGKETTHALTLDVTTFPSELQCLTAAEIEDFLCIFKDHLHPTKSKRQK